MGPCFLVFAWTHHNLGPTFDAFALRSPIAIVVAELITIRLFYWHFGHTQVAFTPFVQIAGIGGAMLVSFVMFWLAEAGVRVLVFRERRPAFLLPGGRLRDRTRLRRHHDARAGVACRREARGRARAGPPVSCREARHRLDLAEPRSDLRTEPGVARKGSLIVWPEGSIPAYIPADLGSVQKEPALPWLGDGSAFLVGGFATDGEQKRYNTAFAIYPDGSVPPLTSSGS